MLQTLLIGLGAGTTSALLYALTEASRLNASDYRQRIRHVRATFALPPISDCKKSAQPHGGHNQDFDEHGHHDLCYLGVGQGRELPFGSRHL